MLAVESEVHKVRIIDPSLDINGLMAIAIRTRPELKQYEELRLAARRQVQVAAAPLYPTFQFFGNVNGNGATLSKTYKLQPAQYAVVPITAAPPAGSAISPPPNSSAPIYAAGTVVQAAEGISRQVKPSYALGFEFDYNYTGLGVPALGNVLAAKATSRQVLLQSNQQYMNVLYELHTSYLNSLIAEQQIAVATKAVASSSEQLRLAQVRLANGVGTNLDVIAAQQAFTQALINKANAILNFNTAQVEVLHALGKSSVDNIASGKLLKANDQN